MSALSLSARRAWIEILITLPEMLNFTVALRKESVDRNHAPKYHRIPLRVALRKESVDRNAFDAFSKIFLKRSLSARRAWIEIQAEHQ